jgi:hypothetical protein
MVLKSNFRVIFWNLFFDIKFISTGRATCDRSKYIKFIKFRGREGLHSCIGRANIALPMQYRWLPTLQKLKPSVRYATM